MCPQLLLLTLLQLPDFIGEAGFLKGSLAYRAVEDVALGSNIWRVATVKSRPKSLCRIFNGISVDICSPTAQWPKTKALKAALQVEPVLPHNLISRGSISILVPVT